MSVKYDVIRMGASNIVSLEMVQKYSVFGFFRYTYIEKLYKNLNCASVVKDIGGFPESDNVLKGDYMKVAVVNLEKKRRYSFVIRLESLKVLSVGELIYIINTLYSPTQSFKDDVFVRFDGYKVY